jgi:hypothetical protein
MKLLPSISMTNVKTSPCLPHPKQWKNRLSSWTLNEGVFSPWNGHNPFQLRPARRSWTCWPITSRMLAASRIRCLTSSGITREAVP